VLRALSVVDSLGGVDSAQQTIAEMRDIIESLGGAGRAVETVALMRRLQCSVRLPPLEHTLDTEAVPDHLVCPISYAVFIDPVISIDGHTYDRNSIERWLCENGTSPMTNAFLPSRLLIPNLAIRSEIEAYTRGAADAALHAPLSPEEELQDKEVAMALYHAVSMRRAWRIVREWSRVQTAQHRKMQHALAWATTQQYNYARKVAADRTRLSIAWQRWRVLGCAVFGLQPSVTPPPPPLLPRQQQPFALHDNSSALSTTVGCLTLGSIAIGQCKQKGLRHHSSDSHISLEQSVKSSIFSEEGWQLLTRMGEHKNPLAQHELADELDFEVLSSCDSGELG